MCCPDCSAAGRDLTQARTCPLAVAMDAVADADRDWFLAHADATELHRPITPAEVQELRFHGIEGMTHVHVLQLKPGLRARNAYVKARRQCA